jgi:heme oxygenase
MTSLIDVGQQPRRDTSVAVPLSVQLREATSTLHLEVERTLGLPGAIRDLAGYMRCLCRFYRLYQPLEVVLGSFGSWPAAGIEIDACAQSPRLAADLRALGMEPAALEAAPHERLPRLPDFSHALGALYVLEGSTLGAQFILPQLVAQMGTSLGGATSFFLAHGAQTAACWKHFREALDRYGVQFPEGRNGVVEGAQSTFAAIGSWMQP